MHSQPSTQRLNVLMRYLLLAIAAMLLLLTVLTVVFLVTRPAAPSSDGSDNHTVGKPDASDNGTSTSAGTPSPVTPDDGVTLPLTADAGITYQDSLTFVGDSLTAHLINRGVLSGGQTTEQVWRAENNMLNLNSQITSAEIIFPGTNESMTIAEAAAKAKPSILIITLGADWGVSYLNEEDFKACYTKLVQAVQKASPRTTIVLQSIFPVTAGCTRLDNAKIDTANTWVKAVAKENGCRYLDTQSVLKDENGCLKAEYCNSTDGIHLGANAYVVILEYIRTHAVTN